MHIWFSITYLLHNLVYYRRTKTRRLNTAVVMSEIGNKFARLRSDYVPPIGHIEEVIINILSRLPVKTVVACKCVAKHWLKLISEPQFPHLQLNWSKKKPKYIICPYPEDYDTINHLCLLEGNGKIIEDVPLFGFDEVCSPEMTCFLNGLISSVNEDSDGLNDVDINIFNPITRDSIVLPRGSPSVVIPSVGVGFDPKSNDFKAFRFFSDSSKGEDVKYKCEVYTSGSTAWRRISEDVQRPQSSPINPLCPYYASIAGTVYWFVWSQDQPGTPVRILSVDMNDSFTKICLPTPLNVWSFLTEIEGCLSVVHFNNPGTYALNQNQDPYLEVYKLENSRWHLRSKSTIDLINVHSINSVAARDTEIFFIIKHDDESICYLIFDFVEESFTTLDLDEQFEGDCPVAFPFVESLLKC
ncbi:F-box protein At5g07610-like isoform X3 [Salvia splendens]|nr:F-box protein At5g07610-like isoform X3 [Salvia splendens]